MMLISPHLYSTLCWPFEEQVVSHEPSSVDLSIPIFNSCFINATTTSPDTAASIHTLGLSRSPQQELHEDINGDPNDHLYSSPAAADPPPSSTVKRKLTHNAIERDRRKKLNTLYSSLRSLLPPTDQQKKLSIPSTVGRILQYIPELQRHIERLKRRKEEVLARMPEKGCIMNPNIVANSTINGRRRSCTSSVISPVVSTTRVSDGEVMVQMCCSSNNGRYNPPLSEILRNLEGEGLVLMNASTFTIYGADCRVMYNLHLQAKGTLRTDEHQMIIPSLMKFVEDSRKRSWTQKTRS